MNEVEAIVRMRNVYKRFGRVQALDDVSLEVGRGRIIGLLGANGCGKSTLLCHIIGLYLPDEGECITFGRWAKDLGPKELARIGYVHQEGELLDWMSVRQLINYVKAYYPGWNEQLEERYVRDFEIELRVRVGALSPGQRQRLAILLAIGFEPELLILDEPAAALDPVARGQFLDLLLQLIQEERRTIIISSHILSDVEKVIDHTLFMKKGRIIKDCGFDELREEYCRVRLTCLNGDLPEELPFGGVLECRREKQQAVLILRNPEREELEEKAQALKCDMEIQTLSLEDIYKIVVNE